MIADIKSSVAEYGKWIRQMGSDNRLMATHISLFTALFINWQRGGFASPFANGLARSIMRLVGSKFIFLLYKKPDHPKGMIRNLLPMVGF